MRAKKQVLSAEDTMPLGAPATVVERYRALYRLKQTTPMRWTKDPRPEWMDP